MRHRERREKGADDGDANVSRHDAGGFPARERLDERRGRHSTSGGRMPLGYEGREDDGGHWRDAPRSRAQTHDASHASHSHDARRSQPGGEASRGADRERRERGEADERREANRTRQIHPGRATRHVREDEARDWGDAGWRGEGWEAEDWKGDGWGADDWGDAAGRSSQRRGSRQRRGDDVWQPGGREPAGRERGLVARGAAVWHETSARAQAVGERPAKPDGGKRGLLPANRRARIITVVMLVVIFVCAVGSLPMSVYAYSSTMSLAKDGVARLKLAETDFKTLATSPTNIAVINDAQSQLQQAHDDFAQIQLRVMLLSPAAITPKVGSKVGAAVRLTPLAVEGTQAGVLACDALKTLVTGMKNPLGTAGGLTSADMQRITSDVDQIHALFGQIAGQIPQLQPADLTIDPRLGPLMAQVEQRLPQITQLVSDLDGFAHALPQLLGVGKPSTYLVLVLDSSELRPTGGFIGNFGALTMTSGRLDPGFHISDITLLDSSVKFGAAKYQQVIQIPAKYAWLKTIFVAGGSDSWSMRDSNLDPDYPTTAQYALQLYPQLLPDAQKNLKAQGSSLTLYNPQTSGQFAGVISLSLGFFQQALGVTGAIQVKDGPINETVTAQNFVQKIHYYALAGTGPDNQACGDTSCAKVFTSDVVKAFMAKVKSNLSLYMGGLAKLFYDSLQTKDIEVYLTAPKAEQTLIDLHRAATAQAPATGDSVFEVEANIGANKDNGFLKYQMSDQISVDQSGAATHHLTWKYTWPNDPATFAESFPAGDPNFHSYSYHSYSRIFTPPSASLIGESNLTGFGQLSASASTFERKVFYGAAYAYPDLGRSETYGVSWKTPGVVTHDSAGYHYHLLFQREAGIVWPLTLTISLPACAKLTGAPQTSGLTSANTYKVKGTTFTLTGPLTQDAQVQLDYTC